ncbi:DEAD/DEAH box helicase [Ferrimonas lipolytica]|uniref:DEAD/DEAH box helicase n=1 Tax=Ferrimonas lipolytica TaxID=2724191 RepID=A0A6H1UC01_9GAMM|nr:DEAD/DEAH box helicase [Ferrimonas lipolytica]QIZ76368.1 DEAD/DEAH box helicase [Ferrimonas lipolytica]
MAYTLRPYQQDAVDAVVKHFRKHRAPAVVVLPTGAGKSLVIAELARLAKGRVLVLTHVQELVAQNQEKFAAFGEYSTIYSAGLGQKDRSAKVVFASVQSLAQISDKITEAYSIVIIDECHRISLTDDSQYQRLLARLGQLNPRLCVLGLTATPYRLDSGWIYQQHINGTVRSTEPKPFRDCVFELPIGQLIKQGFLTPPTMVDGAVASWLLPNEEGELPQVNPELRGRATTLICQQIIEQAQQRQGVIIFAATVRHGEEVLTQLPTAQAALLTAKTSKAERAELIEQFKLKKLKYLVNVAVLTTGFDAPHVDLIALMRRTDSAALFQQMVGRGLRLAEGKTDCLVLDYAGNGYSIYSPEVGEPRPHSDTVAVEVPCPKCGHQNAFWGRKDEFDLVIEHFGRRCQGSHQYEGKTEQCDYRFRYKECPDCLAENDIAARVCHSCNKQLVDPDKRLQEVLKLKDYKVIRCGGVQLSKSQGKDGNARLKVTWFDEDGDELNRTFAFDAPAQKGHFYHQFMRQHLKNPGQPLRLNSIDEVIAQQQLLRHPDFVIARLEKKRFWKVIETLFDYSGRYRKADSAG